MQGFRSRGTGFGFALLAATLLLGSALSTKALAGTRTSALKISGTPTATVIAGTAYRFSPTVSGGRTSKSYSIRNKPAWATFSVATGTLAGIPLPSQVGTYGSITITVSDGSTRTSLAPFNIVVTAPLVAQTPAQNPTPPTTTTTIEPAPTVTGAATINWTPPTQNSDGSTLADLSGYNLYYGSSPTGLTQRLPVANPGATSVTVQNLAAGTYYFAMTAYNSSGMESALSSVGSKSIN